MDLKIKLEQKTGGDFQISFHHSLVSVFKICTAFEQPRLQMVRYFYLLIFLFTTEKLKLSTG